MRRRSTARSVIIGFLMVGVAATGLAQPAPALGHDPGPVVHGAGAASAIPDTYIVKLKNGASLRAVGVAARATSLASRFHGRVERVWEHAIHGFSAIMSASDALALAADPDVEYVEQAQRMSVAGTQANPPSWGIDRIDQRTLPVDHSLSYEESQGAGVHAYIVDTGVRATHTDFGGRATSGWDFVSNDAVADDCNGHGTHVAGIIGGAIHGVAKKAQLVAVRSFDCSGNSSGTLLLDGINWVIAHAIRPSVLNLSIGTRCVDGSGNTVPCPPGSEQAIVDAETNAAAAGITVVVAAGNDNQNACNNPYAAVPQAITVGATTLTDARAAFSNLGPCVDIWAPGEVILSDGSTSDTAVDVRDGTSMAAPHVAGAVALLLGTPAFKEATPAGIATQLGNVATRGVLTGLGNGSPNALLMVAPAVPYGGTPIALVPNANGRLTLFGIGSTGNYLATTQTTANAATWGAWSTSASPGWSSVAAEPNLDGRIEWVALGTAGQTWQRQQSAPNSSLWLGWSQLDGLLTSVALARQNAGMIRMVGTNRQGQVWFRAQTAVNGQAWSTPLKDGFAGKMRSVSAASNADGRVEIIGIDSFGSVWRKAQAKTDSNEWYEFQRFDGASAKSMSEVSITRNSGGTLELVGTDGLGGVWHRRQTAPNVDDWTPWTLIGPNKILRHLAAETNAEGRVLLVGVDNGGNVWQCTQTAAGSDTYTAWTPITGAKLRS